MTALRKLARNVAHKRMELDEWSHVNKKLKDGTYTSCFAKDWRSVSGYLTGRTGTLKNTGAKRKRKPGSSLYHKMV